MHSLQHALGYAGEGIRVIWIPPRSKGPVAKGWPAMATTDPDTIKKWAAEHPDCNFGLCMGGGFVALDIDDPTKLPELKAKGFALPETRVHRTASGLHFLYRVPQGITIKNAVKKFGIIDIRHEGGQIVAPGSTHPSGFVYEVANDRPIAALPDALIAMLTESEPPQASASAADGAIPEGRRNSTLFNLARNMHRAGVSDNAIRAALYEERARCENPHTLPDDEINRIVRSSARYQTGDPTSLFRDSRPSVMLPSDDRLMSDCAAELGGHLADVLYCLNGEVVTLEGSTPRAVSPQMFRTLVENFAVCARQRIAKKVSIDVHVTMTVEEARGILASDHFRKKLRPLKRIASCRLPVLRGDGVIELLPEGYDRETATLTVSETEYDADMSFEEGIAVIRDLYSEFEFADGARSLSVAVTALVGLFAAQLVDTGSLRPVYAVTKNSPGAGATLLASCAVVPVLGSMPSGVAPNEDAEMRKTLTATLREGRTVLVIDNVKGRIDLPSLEAFTTAHIWRDRMLGSNESFEGVNNVTTFITANGVTITEDLRRRILFVELHLSVERPEDRVFKRKLDETILRAMRPRILAACWAVIKHWDAQGRPQASRTHSFPSWDSVIGGIVESAGFGCPFTPAAAAAVADEDGDSMHSLVAAMKPGRRYTSKEVAGLCRAESAFVGLVGASDFDMQRSHLSAFGRVLGRWNNRQVGERKFVIEGSGHKRRFFIIAAAKQHGRMVEHGFPPECTKNNFSSLGRKTMSDHATMQLHRLTKTPKFARAGHKTLRRSFSK
jgi:Bifunctional DNA primase/polymerase, N-terminal/Primase C terminal 1 (PriCT-1)